MEQQPEEFQILVVDDNSNNRELIIEVLGRVKGYKFDFCQASNGLQAVEIAEIEKPQVILLDIEMPHMDGYDVCRKLRANPDLAAVQIIVITAKAEKADKLLAEQLGANQYMIKPYDIMTLRQSVIVAIDAYKKAKSAAPAAADDDSPVTQPMLPKAEAPAASPAPKPAESAPAEPSAPAAPSAPTPAPTPASQPTSDAPSASGTDAPSKS